MSANINAKHLDLDDSYLREILSKQASVYQYQKDDLQAYSLGGPRSTDISATTGMLLCGSLARSDAGD